jgi:hypothetical protein
VPIAPILCSRAQNDDAVLGRRAALERLVDVISPALVARPEAYARRLDTSIDIVDVFERFFPTGDEVDDIEDGEAFELALSEE